MNRRSICALLLAFSLALPAFPVSMNFGGSFRAEANYYNKLGLGLPNRNPSKTFLSGRALLDPTLIIDDHFSVKSQWSLLQSPAFAPACTPLGVGQGGYVFGDVQSEALMLCRAWFEWTSDFGILKMGRMPFSWGYGLVWDAGEGTWDDFQTTLDRLEYRLYLGNVVGGLAYSKGRKISVLGNENDQEFYTVYLQYDNREEEVEGGILYEKQVRSTAQSSDLVRGTVANQSNPSPNPYALPLTVPGAQQFPISNKIGYPLSSNVLDIYLRKTTGRFTFGGEINWMTGSAADYNGSGSPDDLNAIGVTANVAYEASAFKLFTEFLYASGDTDFANNTMTGFVMLNRNRRPGLILGRELLGPYYGNTVAQGSHVVYGDADTFSGVYFFRPGLKYDWSSAWSSGLELVIARKASVAPGDDANLGVEVDLGTDYTVYKNFQLGGAMGYLFPGNGLRVPGAQGPFAVRTTLSLKF